MNAVSEVIKDKLNASTFFANEEDGYHIRIHEMALDGDPHLHGEHGV